MLQIISCCKIEFLIFWVTFPYNKKKKRYKKNQKQKTKTNLWNVNNFFKKRKRTKSITVMKKKKERKQLQIKTSLKRICKIENLKLILMHNYVTLFFIHRRFFFNFQIFNHRAREINPQIYHDENIICVHHTIKHIRLWYV